MIDAMDWVRQHCSRKTIDEPTLAYGMADVVATGECYADGAIGSNCGGRHEKGQVWVRADQAARAAYYGWNQAGISQVQQDGTVLTVVFR